MLRVTFLGHQGWLLASGATHVLVDPLLTRGFGHGGKLGVVWPPRAIDLSAMPAIDAVVLTHEHDDHFDLPSLSQLDRKTPVYLSARSSRAAKTVLSEMGFTVLSLQADRSYTIGALEYRTFYAEPRAAGRDDEWDVMPFLVRDQQGGASFFSSVDVRAGADVLSQLRALSPRAGIWAYANNVTHGAFCDALGRTPSARGDEDALARVAVRRHAEVERAWTELGATLVCGNGWSFPGQRAWMNHNMFPVDNDALVAAVQATSPVGSVSAALPGQTWACVDGLVTRSDDSTFVRCLPRSEWPTRGYVADATGPGDYDPACGKETLDNAEIARLGEQAQALARYFYGRAIFGGVCALSSAAAGGRVPTLALSLRVDRSARRHVLEYDASGCCFSEADVDDPIGHYASGLECWASDLLALLGGDIAPSALCFSGRARHWNHAPQTLRMTAHELWQFAHPLHRPDVALRLYRKIAT